MKKLRQILILGALISSLTGSAQMLLDYESGTTTTGATEIPMPVRDIEYLPDGNIRVTYTFSHALLTKQVGMGKYYFWNLGGFGFSMSEGSRALPCRTDCFYVPEGKTVKVSLEEVKTKTFNYRLATSQRPAIESAGGGNNSNNEAAMAPLSPLALGPFDSNDLFNRVKLQSITTYRGIDMANIVVKPIVVWYEGGTLSETVLAAEKLSYLVEFVDEESSSPSNVTQKRRDLCLAVDDPMIVWGTEQDPLQEGNIPSFGGNGTSPLNPVGFSSDLAGRAVSVDNTYVIITTDYLKSSVDSFADWKRYQGYNVIILSAPSWSYISAKAAVDAAYSEYPDTYHLLIVGGAEDVPGLSLNHKIDGVTYFSDRSYSIVGSDESDLPSVSVGRIPFSNPTEVYDVLYKIQRYEELPATSMVPKKLTAVSYFSDKNYDGYEDIRATQTSNEIYEYLRIYSQTSLERIFKAESDVNPTNWSRPPYSVGKPLYGDLRRPDFLWDGSKQSILSAINDGTTILTYRGYGKADGWSSFSFSNNDLTSLNNTKFPIVYSIACSTGKYGSGDCFASEFLKGKSKGSVCVVAPSTDVYEGVTDEILAALMNAHWPNPGIMPQFAVPTGKVLPHTKPLKSIGEVFLQAMKRSGERFSNTWKEEYKTTVNSFHIFGDPSMYINTEDLISAASLTTVTRYDRNLSLPGSLPIITVKVDQNAYIGFYNKVNGDTKRYFGRFINFFPELGDDWAITVYGPGLRPYSNEIRTITGPIFPGLNSASYHPSTGDVVISLNLEGTDEVGYTLEVRDSFGLLVARQDGCGNENERLSVASSKSGVHVVSLLVDGVLVDSKHFLK